MAVRATGRAVNMRVITDCAYVYENGNSLIESGEILRANRDLWVELQQAVAKRTAPFHFVQVRAHQEDSDLHAADWDQWRMATGNALADQRANLAADEAQ
jgi:ribonuclease HI